MRETGVAFRRSFALVVAALLMSSPTHAGPGAGAESKKRANQEVSWLSSSEHELLRRSYLRCLRAHYARIGDAQPEAALLAAFNRDLDVLTLLITQEDVRRAPRVQASRVPHIACAWFNDGSAPSRW